VRSEQWASWIGDERSRLHSNLIAVATFNRLALLELVPADDVSTLRPRAVRQVTRPRRRTEFMY